MRELDVHFSHEVTADNEPLSLVKAVKLSLYSGIDTLDPAELPLLSSSESPDTLDSLHNNQQSDPPSQLLHNSNADSFNAAHDNVGKLLNNVDES